MVNLIRTAIIVTFLMMALVAGCTKQDAAVNEVAKSLENQDKLAEIHVFYPSTDVIVEEVREIEKSKVGPEEAVRQVFMARHGGDKQTSVMPTTEVISVKIDNGTAIVNFKRSVLDFTAPELNQQLVVAAVVKTLEQFSEVKQVKFQVEGLEKGEIGGKDVEKFWGSITLKSQPWKVQ